MTLNKKKMLSRSLNWLIVIGLPFVIFYLISNGNINVFLTDDNYSQWLPVINASFESFLETGKLNYFEMHIMNGINMLDTGIYSLLNPFMFLSYIIFIVTGVSNTITIYIYLITVCSLAIYNFVMIKLQIKRSVRFVLLLCLLCTGAFYVFSYWYYIFNNLLISALIFFGIICVRGKLRCVYFGVIMGFSIYLGNVQYSVMWYLFYAVYSIVDGLIKKEKSCIWIFLSNIVIGLALSFPQIVLSMRAALESPFFGAYNDQFFSETLCLRNILLFGIIPENLFRILGLEDVSGRPWFGNTFFFCGILFVSFLLGWYLIVKRKKSRTVLLPCLVCATVMLLFTLGKGFVVADILYHFPVFNSFRLLNKGYFVFVPILFMVCILVYINLDNKKRRNLILAGVILSFINIVSVQVGGYRPVFENSIPELENRTVTFIECPNDLYASFNSNMELTVIRNWPCYFHIYTLGGYNLSYKEKSYLICNQIFDTSQHWSEYSYANAVNLTNWLNRYNSQDIDLKGWEEQLKNNSVSNLIVKYDDEKTFFNFLEIVNQLRDLKIDNIADIKGNIKIVSLLGVEPMVSDNLGNSLNIDAISNGIMITSNVGRIEGDINTQILFNNKYKAYAYVPDKQELDIKENESGYLTIKNFYSADKVILIYKDLISTLSVVFAIISFFSWICVFVLSLKELTIDSVVKDGLV